MGWGTPPIVQTEGSRRPTSVVQANPLATNLSQPEIPSLYGLRGLAALAVVFYHYSDQRGFTALFPGPYAVTLFFELSGLLITWLLLKEIDETGRLDRGQFYFRRGLRLFPVFYVVWGLCRLARSFPGSWAMFFYMGDYYHALHQNYSMLTVAWSLGVEEKFYLLWPFLLTRIQRPTLIKFLYGILIAQPIYRSALSLCGYRPYTWFAFDCHLDAIVLGCLIAITARRNWIVPAWIAHPCTPICALILIFALQSQTDVVTYLLAVILVSVVLRPSPLLNNRVTRYLGIISYSLYLCHGYARDALWPWISRGVTLRNPLLVFLAQFALAITVATALHFAIERPFLILKHRFHGKKQATRPSTTVVDIGC
jgi:peptidoglycan/LPS O-acetylase OafA/YrhL